MTAYAVKVEGGIAKIYDAQTGGYLGRVGSNVVSAQITGELVQVTEKNGSVKIYSAKTCGYLRTI